MSARLAIALSCLLLVPALPAAEPEGRSIPYQKLYEPLAAVKKADPAGVVIASLRAEPAATDGTLPADLRIELRHGADREVLPVDPAGSFEMPMHPGWAGGDAALWINQPKTSVKIVENFNMRTPATMRLTYGQLMESVLVMERIQQQHVEIAGLMTTRPAGVELAYEPGGSQFVTVGSGAQARTWNSDARGHVRVPFDPTIPADASVSLSALPAALQPYAP